MMRAALAGNNDNGPGLPMGTLADNDFCSSCGGELSAVRRIFEGSV